MKKIYWSITIIVILIAAYGWLAGYRFSMSAAISAGFNKEYKVILSEDMPYGKAVLYEDVFGGTFGVGKLDMLWGMLYRHGGESGGHVVRDGNPFEAAGYGSGGNEKWFLVGVRLADDSPIQYISSGNHLQELANGLYTMSFDDVLANSEHYEWMEATGGYALLVLDDYTEESWMIRAFDRKGMLIADKPFAEQPRFVLQEQP